MNIKQAFNTFGNSKEFVDYCMKQGYSYFIKIEGKNEQGWIWNRNGTKQYKFNY